MCGTIHAIAVGAAAICIAVCAAPGRALVADVSPEAEGALDNDDASPVAIVEPGAAPTFEFDAEAAHTFSWTSDVLSAPPYVIAATESDFVPPSASSTAIPLPPAVWTGFAGLGALGVASYLRRLKLRR
jgi:hypothetical protein